MLLFIDGMDQCNQTQEQLKWDAGGSLNWASTAGRFGGGSMFANFNQGGSAYQSNSKSITSGSTFIVGFAFKATTFFTPAWILRLFLNSTTQFGIVVTALGQLALLSGDGTTLATATSTLSANVWYWIEVKVTLSTSISAGQCILNVNNTTVLNLAAATRTVNTSSTTYTANFVSLGTGIPYGSYNSGTCDFYFDDFYICDNTGSINNDFLGDSRIETLYPNAAGNYTTFTPNGAAINYGCVNEAQADDDTTYVSSNTIGNIDTYLFTNITGTVISISGLQVIPKVRKDNAGAREVARVFRASSVDYIGSNYNLSTSYLYYPEILERSPATSAAWTGAEIAVLEVGLKLTV